MGKQKSKQQDTCPVSWNPGEWPYTTRCSNTRGHRGKHRDRQGRELANLGKAQEDACED